MNIRKLLICLAFLSISFVSLGSPLSSGSSTEPSSSGSSAEPSSSGSSAEPLSSGSSAESLSFSDTRSMVTYFRMGESRFDPGYRGNSKRMSLVGNFLRQLSRDSTVLVDSLVIRAGSSPEGNPAFNKILSDQRVATIYDQVVAMVPELAPKIITYSLGEDWGGLYRAIRDDPNVPRRDEVLNILTFSSTRDRREFFLRDLSDGQSWRYIAANILPNLRSGVQVHYRDLDPIQDRVAIHYTKSPSRDTVYVVQRDTIYIDSPLPIPSVKIPDKIGGDSIPSSMVSLSSSSSVAVVKSEGRPTWALKTNLIYWAALQGNVEAEFYLGNRWSLNFEYQVAWWTNPVRHQYYQYMQCGPEGRYWFKSDGQFRGHYIGLHVGFGLYDLSWGIAKGEESGKPTYADYQGYQGEFAIALGISYGHVWKLGRSLNLELGLGFGYVMTEYRRYNYQDTHYVYQATERMQFVGPTKARLALLWQFGRGAGRGARR